MTASSAEPMFSTPRYALEASRHPASRRLVVAQQASDAAALLDDPAPTLLLCLGEALPGSVEQESLPSCEALYLRLQMLLEQAQAGTRLYVCGDESFLWHIHSLARQAGHTGSLMSFVHDSGFSLGSIDAARVTPVLRDRSGAGRAM